LHLEHGDSRQSTRSRRREQPIPALVRTPPNIHKVLFRFGALVLAAGDTSLLIESRDKPAAVSTHIAFLSQCGPVFGWPAGQKFACVLCYLFHLCTNAHDLGVSEITTNADRR
jgi:hypothetical protein